ncbi:MAG: protein GrpE [Nitrospirales bacterium]|nr:MAG: protein GrpE [Nitrospirales bacterium]
MSTSDHPIQEDAPESEGSTPCSSTEQTEDIAQETTGPDTIETLRQDLKAKTEEADTAHDKYLRLAAEFDNYKRRSQRDQSDAIKFANEKLIKDLLPTLENLERAIQAAQEQNLTGALLEGVILTHKQFLETLTKLGLQQISSLGEPFDPSKHQAVAQVESDTAQPNTVIEEYQKGYFLHERILRPAMVTVAKSQSDQDTNTNSEPSCTEGG